MMQSPPPAYAALLEATANTGFNMSSDLHTGQLLRTLAASRPGGRLLELGTGTGLSTSWLLDGMDKNATLISIDNDAMLLAVARQHLGNNARLQLVCSDGAAWIEAHRGSQFDLIFADTWHGKFLLLEETLALLREGGLYILDDLLPQPNWPEGHQQKVQELVATLVQRDDLAIAQADWSTGILIAAKK